MEFPIEILYKIASFCKYYKTLGNLLLVSKDLREYIEAYPKCKEKLKKVVCENVNEFSSEELDGEYNRWRGTFLGIHYASYYILPNGSKHGEYKISSKPFTENSFIRGQCFYRDGKIEGECRLWCDERLWQQWFCKNDELEGEYKRWWDDGRLFKQCFYKNGKKEGKRKEWRDNGKLFKQCFYKNGMEFPF